MTKQKTKTQRFLTENLIKGRTIYITNKFRYYLEYFLTASNLSIADVDVSQGGFTISKARL